MFRLKQPSPKPYDQFVNVSKSWIMKATCTRALLNIDNVISMRREMFLNFALKLVIVVLLYLIFSLMKPFIFTASRLRLNNLTTEMAL